MVSVKGQQLCVAVYSNSFLQPCRCHYVLPRTLRFWRSLVAVGHCYLQSCLRCLRSWLLWEAQLACPWVGGFRRHRCRLLLKHRLDHLAAVRRCRFLHALVPDPAPPCLVYDALLWRKGCASVSAGRLLSAFQSTGHASRRPVSLEAQRLRPCFTTHHWSLAQRLRPCCAAQH